MWCVDEYRFEASQAAEFNKVLNDTLTKVVQQAAVDKTPGMKLATMEADLPFNGSSTLYTLAQCVPNISPDVCLQCLYEGMTNWLPRWCSGIGAGKVICSSCLVQYQPTRFYGSAPAAPPPIVSHYPKGFFLYSAIWYLHLNWINESDVCRLCQ